MADAFTLTIDPAQVLGVHAGSSLEEIRDAYRAKAKRYHPDAGGEEWAFRILVQSYEILSVARVTRATIREAAAPPRTAPSARGATGSGTNSSERQAHARQNPHTPPPRSDHGSRPPIDPSAPRESVRQGVRETAADPSRIIDVEKLSIRYQPEHVWLITDHGQEHRFLSACLNLTWPSPDLATPPDEIPGAAAVLESLDIVFADISTKTGSNSARSEVVDGRFNGWLSYRTSDEAGNAFNMLRRALHDIGLAVNQTSRDMVIPARR